MFLTTFYRFTALLNPSQSGARLRVSLIQMNYKGWLILVVLSVVAGVPLFTSWIPLFTFSPIPTEVYPGNHAFTHETGVRTAYGWESHYREHMPGYLIK